MLDEIYAMLVCMRYKQMIEFNLLILCNNCLEKQCFYEPNLLVIRPQIITIACDIN